MERLTKNVLLTAKVSVRQREIAVRNVEIVFGNYFYFDSRQFF